MADKKVAFVIDGLQMGGAEKFLINNANYFYNNGYDPLVILLSDEKTLIDELNKCIKVVMVVRSSKYDLFISRKIKRLIESEGIGKVFCINTYAFFLTKLAYLFDNKTQFYLSLHTTIPATVKSYWQNMVYTRFVTSRDLVIYICNNQKAYLQRKYFFHPKHELVVYNGIDTTYFNPSNISKEEISSLRATLNLKNDDKVIIKVARLFKGKGHTHAIDALKILHDKTHDKPYLLFIGGGENDYVDSLKRYAKQMEIAKYVLFAGNQTDVRKFYRLADLFTLTSYSVETFSLAALEAMAFGLPCSLTNIGGASEMMIEGKTGFLSNPNSAVSIAESWEKILHMDFKAEFIRNFILDKFSSEKMLASYASIVQHN